MKAKKKTNHLLEEADMIKQIPDENRFLARLRKTWARITRFMRSCCTSIQEERSVEKLPEPSGLNMEELPRPCWIKMKEEFLNPSGIIMEEEPSDPSIINMEEELPEPSMIKIEDSKDTFFTAKVSAEVKVENVEQNPNIPTNNEEAEVMVTDRFVEQEIEAEHQRLLDPIHSQEDLYIQYYTSQQEILTEYDPYIYDEIQITEDLHIQDYDTEDEEELDCIVEDDEEIKIKEDGEDGLEKSDNTKESQSASCEMPGPSHISNRDNKSSKGKENENNKGEENSITINEQREECASKQMSSSRSSFLEEEMPEELYKSSKAILYKQKAFQSGSSHDEEPSTSVEKLVQPGEKTLSIVPLTLECFTFHQALGEGGFAKVFLASDKIRKECVAIKVLSKCLFIEDEQNFVERKILELSHESPYLIHGLAAFHTEKMMYYVLELATKGDLFNFFVCKNAFPDTPTIQFIMAEVICGTQFLHKKNIIHRDLKPENVLVTADGHIKITDFGLSVMGVYERTQEDSRGTPGYMAPEMVRNQEHGRGADYFAIGVILYNLATIQYPFPGDDDVTEVQHSVLHYTPLYPEYLTPETVDILQGLLCKDQDYRLGVIGDIKKHPFFSNINWEDVEARRMEPPAFMTEDFVDLNMDQTLDYMEMPDIEIPEDQKIFTEFSFVCPDWSQDYHPVNNEATQ